MYDLQAVCATVDLRKLIAADVGFADDSGLFDCPFCGEGSERPPWCGDDPALRVSPDNRRFRCRDCKASGSALDWIARRMNCGILDAARKLVPNLEAFRKPDVPRETRIGKPKAGRAKGKAGRKAKKSWNPERVWNTRTWRIAECNMNAGFARQDAWAEAIGAVAEMRASSNPEAAWHAYLDADPAVKAAVENARAQRRREAS